MKKKIMHLVVLLILFISTVSTSVAQEIVWSNNEEMNNKKINAIDIIESIVKGEDICIENKEIVGELNFVLAGTPLKVGGKTYVVNIDSQISFINCIFTGKILGSKKDNNNNYYVRFSRPVSFLGSEIREEIIFFKTVFEAPVDFSYSVFEKKALFKSSLWKETAKFGDSIFKNHADFRTTIFFSRAIFSRSHFNSDLSFLGSNFNDTGEFDSIVFKKGMCDFHKTTFGRAKFGYANIGGESFNISESVFLFEADFGAAIISKANFNKTDMRGIVLFQITKISDASFKSAQFNTSNIDFDGAIFSKYDFTGAEKFGTQYSPFN